MDEQSLKLNEENSDTERNQASDETALTEEKQTLYHDSGYNRNKTLIPKYVNRILKEFPTPTERYYDIRLVSAANRRSYFGEVGDQCIMFHSNRLCLLALAPTHPVMSEDKTIERVEFTFDGHERIDRLTNQLRGKGKKGGQKLQKYAPVCAIICSDGIKYVITACISSRLIEVNQAISNRFDLIKTKPLSSGFIAIVQPSDWKNLDEFKASLPKLGQDIQNVCEEDPEE